MFTFDFGEKQINDTELVTFNSTVFEFRLNLEKDNKLDYLPVRIEDYDLLHL